MAQSGNPSITYKSDERLNKLSPLLPEGGALFKINREEKTML